MGIPLGFGLRGRETMTVVVWKGGAIGKLADSLAQWTINH